MGAARPAVAVATATSFAVSHDGLGVNALQEVPACLHDLSRLLHELVAAGAGNADLLHIKTAELASCQAITTSGTHESHDYLL